MKRQKKQAGIWISAILLALLLTVPALAQGPGGPGGGPGGPGNGMGAHGKITAVDSGSITVTDRDGISKTLTLTAATVVTKDGQSAKISDVAVGLFAEISSTDGKTAAGIDLHDGPPPGGPGGPGPGGPGGGQGPPPN